MTSKTRHSNCVGYEPIDSEHAEFICLLKRLADARDDDFPTLYRALFEHTEQHFDLENRLMAEYHFPAEV